MAVCVSAQGTLAQAVKKGQWILLDEINLAAAETLECLSGLLEGSAGSLVLLDRGDTGESQTKWLFDSGIVGQYVPW